MECSQDSNHEPVYHDLLNRLERASESLSFYKNNKEICKRDMQKLELENSALAEENDYLKKRIKNAERNVSLMLNKSTDGLDTSQDNPFSMSYVSYKAAGYMSQKRFPSNSIKFIKETDNATTAASHRKQDSGPLRLSCATRASASSLRKEFNLQQYAMKQHALFLHF